MMAVYIDVLFLINFSVDYIILTLTASVFHYRIKKWRELLTAFLLSSYSLWALLLCGSYILLITTAVLVSVGACCFAYPIRSVAAILKTWLLFVTMSALFAGLVDVLFRFIKSVIGSGGVADDGKKVIVFALLALISSLLIRFGNKMLEKRKGTKSVKVSFRLFDKLFQAELLLDSGNLVIEPLSGRRVMFLTEKYIMNHKIKQYINNEENRKFERVICVNTAAGKRALRAFLCDEVILDGKTVAAAVAIMSECNIVDAYDGIFPTALL